MSNPPAKGRYGNKLPPSHLQGKSPVEVAMDTSEAEPEVTDVRLVSLTIY